MIPIDADGTPLPIYCPVFGFEIVYSNKGCQKFNSMGFDRKIPELGYTKENCHFISSMANSAKGNLEWSELLRILKDTETLH